MCPEAAEGGPIAALKNGDMIEIDIPKRKLNVVLDNDELTRRLKLWKPKKKGIKKGYLRRYVHFVQPADKGGILTNP